MHGKNIILQHNNDTLEFRRVNYLLGWQQLIEVTAYEYLSCSFRVSDMLFLKYRLGNLEDGVIELVIY